MKRTLARLGLLAVLAGTPLALRLLVGAPAIPSFAGSDGLSGSYVSPDAVLALVALLTWTLWAYTALAVLLHSLALVATSTNAPGQRTLLAVSTMLTPKIVRAVVELAIGSALVTASVTVRAPSALPAVSHAPPTHAPSIGAAAVTPTSTARQESSRDTYRVQQGDSLWRIAERQLGSGFRWREIFRLNESRRFPDGRSLTDPHLIFPGWVLELPDTEGAAHGHPHRVEHEGQPGNRPPVEKSTTPTPSTVASPPTAALRTPPDDVDREGQDDAQVEATGSHGPTVELPSGLLIAASFASGLLTAHLLGRLHRRRSRRLKGIESVETPATPDLIRDLRRAGASEMAGPIELALDVVIDAWLERAGSWPQILAAVESAERVWVVLADDVFELPPSTGGTLSPGIRFAHSGSYAIAEVSGPFSPRLRQARTPLERGVLVPLGRTTDGSVVHVSLTGLGHVAVAGASASNLLAQLVLAGATQGGPEELHLVVLGESEQMAGLRRLPQVVTNHTWEEADATAMREVELELMRRARLFLKEGVDDIYAHLPERSDEQLPAIVVVWEEPAATEIGMIEALGQQAAKLGAAVLISGNATTAAVLTARVGQSIELDTELPLPSPLEPFSLDALAQQEAIEVILEAHPPELGEPREEPPDEVDSRESPDASVQEMTGPPVFVADEGPMRPLDEPPAPGPPMMTIRCLGAFEISRGDTPMRTGWKAKGRELLAYLVANPSGAPKERIIDELWPEIDPKTAGARFDRCATVVRSLARGTEDPGMYVERVGESTYRLEEGAWWIDAWEFERLIRDAERSDDGAEALSGFHAALALYGGEFCDDAYYPWAESARERYRNLFVEASARLAYLLSEAGAPDEALSVLDHAITVDPVCEDLVRRAMAVEAALGRRASALARYRKLEARLDEELGVEPDPESKALLQRMLRPIERAG